MKVPFIPFYNPSAKTYTGIEEMRMGELDFFKATVMSKSTELFLCVMMFLWKNLCKIKNGQKNICSELQ